MGKKAKISEENLEESRRLKALFQKRTKLTQEKFGGHYEIGTQGMVWQYLNGRAALNTDAAIKFAHGLVCNVEDFSPRLAKGLASAPATKTAKAARGDSPAREPQEAAGDYKSNVQQIPVKPDPSTAAILEILANTDETGRAMALAAIRVALEGYKPAKANRAS